MTVDIPAGSAIITPEKMYEEILLLRDGLRDVKSLLDPTLKELREKIDKIPEDFKEIVAEQKLGFDKELKVVVTRLNKHADDISWLKSRVYMALGALALISIVGGWLISLAMSK